MNKDRSLINGVPFIRPSKTIVPFGFDQVFNLEKYKKALSELVTNSSFDISNYKRKRLLLELEQVSKKITEIKISLLYEEIFELNTSKQLL